VGVGRGVGVLDVAAGVGDADVGSGAGAADVATAEVGGAALLGAETDDDAEDEVAGVGEGADALVDDALHPDKPSARTQASPAAVRTRVMSAPDARLHCIVTAVVPAAQ